MIPASSGFWFTPLMIGILVLVIIVLIRALWRRRTRRRPVI